MIKKLCLFLVLFTFAGFSFGQDLNDGSDEIEVGEENCFVAKAVVFDFMPVYVFDERGMTTTRWPVEIILRFDGANHKVRNEDYNYQAEPVLASVGDFVQLCINHVGLNTIKPMVR
jgi:hypothetical protein